MPETQSTFKLVQELPIKAMIPVKDISCTYPEYQHQGLKGEMVSPFGNDAFNGLVTTIRKNGCLALPIYINQKKQVISGHFRFLGAREAGLKEVPVRLVKNIEEVDYGQD